MSRARRMRDHKMAADDNDFDTQGHDGRPRRKGSNTMISSNDPVVPILSSYHQAQSTTMLSRSFCSHHLTPWEAQNFERSLLSRDCSSAMQNLVVERKAR